MTEEFYSVSRSASIELEEKKSRFIAHCRPLASEAEAESFIGLIRGRYPDASHNVYGWILGLDIRRQKYSDDGEPQGTAGMPVLEVLQKNNVIQTGIVVTRYFGGVQLGAGGLVRAYTASAAGALKAAGICKYQLCKKLKITVAYNFLDKLRSRFMRENIQEISCAYEVEAVVEVAVPANEIEIVSSLVADVSGGTALITPEAQVYLPLPLPDPPDKV